MNRQRHSFGRFGPYPEHEIYEARRTLQMLFSNNRNRFVARVIEKCRLTPPGQTFHRSDIWKKTQNDPLAIQEQASGSKHDISESSKKEPEATLGRPEEPKQVGLGLVSKEQPPGKENPYVLDNIYQSPFADTIDQSKEKSVTNQQDHTCHSPSTCDPSADKVIAMKSASAQSEKPLFFLDRKGNADVSVGSKELLPTSSTSQSDSKPDCLIVDVNLAGTRRNSTVSQPSDTTTMADTSKNSLIHTSISHTQQGMSSSKEIFNDMKPDELVVIESDMEDEIVVIESETQEEVIPETQEDLVIKLVCDFCGHKENKKNTIKMKLHLTSAKHSAASLVEGKMNNGKFEALTCRRPECIKNPNVEYTNLVPLCPLCYSFFPSIWLCAAHFNKFHRLSGKTDCYGLGNITDTKTLVIRSDFTCDKCSKVFGSQKALHTHWKSTVHFPYDIPSEDQVIICTCPYCKCFFSDFVQCRMHIIQSHIKEGNETALTVLYVEKPKVTHAVLPVNRLPKAVKFSKKLEARLKKCSNGNKDKIIARFFQRKERRKLSKKMSKLRKKKGDSSDLQIQN